MNGVIFECILLLHFIFRLLMHGKPLRVPIFKNSKSLFIPMSRLYVFKWHTLILVFFSPQDLKH